MKFRYRNEEKMKDSGVEWIGKIPRDWKISRINKEFRVRNEKVSDKVFPALSVTKQGILPQLENVAKSDNSDNRKKVCEGDFVINSRADRKGSCGVSVYDGSVSLICNVLTPKHLNSQYVHSLFRNYYFSEEFYRWGSGIVDDLWSTNIERMKKINVPIPNENEDIKIANFLDKKTAQFDTIILKKEALIKTLEEAKKSLISEVVTGKVKVVKTSDGYELVERKKEEMKDSGVEWLGDVPKEWVVKALKNTCSLVTGKASTGEFEIYIGLENVEKWTGKLIEYGKATEVDSEKNSVFYNNNVLFGKLRPYLAKCIVSKETGICSDEFLVMETKCLLPEVLKFTMLNPLFIDLVNSLTYGVKMPRANWELVSDIKITYPNMYEQEIISNYLLCKFNEIDDLVMKIQKQIIGIKEAKQSLISEAVTGKIEILD
ncbi:restriction endonuclease subunit S [Clostridium sp.]|uniref:restriction endonuclease subunit S n=1 Tax=Clostridium sp. TaxID=1506 RepID=UPI003217AB83